MEPKIIILSGSSGVGKSTLVRQLLEVTKPYFSLELSVSAATRAPREGEQDGREYHFLSREDFFAREKRGEFLETFEVFGHGDWYGTLKTEVTERFARGCFPLLEVDVNGAERIVEQYPDAISFFITAGSIEELTKRLEGRGTESQKTLKNRLAVAEAEMKKARTFYKYTILNDDVARATDEILQILLEETGNV